MFPFLPQLVFLIWCPAPSIASLSLLTGSIFFQCSMSGRQECGRKREGSMSNRSWESILYASLNKKIFALTYPLKSQSQKSINHCWSQFVICSFLQILSDICLLFACGTHCGFPTGVKSNKLVQQLGESLGHHESNPVSKTFLIISKSCSKHQS